MSKIWLEGFWKAHPEPFIHLAQVATAGFWNQGSAT